MNYCTVCGKKLIKEFVGKYSTNDGKKCYRLICPDEPCKHGHHDVKKYKNSSDHGGADAFCKRCGIKWITDFYFCNTIEAWFKGLPTRHWSDDLEINSDGSFVLLTEECGE